MMEGANFYKSPDFGTLNKKLLTMICFDKFQFRYCSKKT